MGQVMLSLFQLRATPMQLQRLSFKTFKEFLFLEHKLDVKSLIRSQDILDTHISVLH